MFCTVTGNKHVIRLEHMKRMKNGALMANSGHFDIEVDIAALAKASSSTRRVRPFMEEYVLAGRKLFILGEGRLVNLAAAEGHPSEVMSTSFCGQALSCEYGVKNRGKMPVQVIQLPEAVDNDIAALQLKVMGIGIDKMTAEQVAYMSSWQEGT